MKEKFTILLALALGFAVCAVAQDSQAVNKQKHHHYKLVVIGTFGGPNSFFTDYPGNTIGMLNNHGSFTGNADIPMLDPYGPNFQWADGYVSHAFRWQNGVTKDLGALPGGANSASTWISANGLMAGASENGQIDPLYAEMPEIHAVIWRDGKIEDLGTLEGGHESGAYAINSRGQVVGAATNTVPDANSMAADSWWLWGFGVANYQYQTRAFLWDNEKGMQDLGTLGTGTNARALFINESGQIAGISYISSDPSPACAQPDIGYAAMTTGAFLWENGKMVDLGNFGGTCTLVSDLNNRGQVVGAAWITGDQAVRPFLWSNGLLQDLGGSLGGTATNATAINQNGEVVGAASLPGDGTITHAVLWRHVGGFTDLGTVGNDPCAFAWAINDATQVVGLSSPSDCVNYDVSRPFLWENGSMVDLNSLIPPNSPLTLVYAYAINDLGEIVGNGPDVNGNGHAFLLIPCDQNHPRLEGCDYDPVAVSLEPQLPPAQMTHAAAASPAKHSPAAQLGRFPSSRAGRNRRYATPQTSPQ